MVVVSCGILFDVKMAAHTPENIGGVSTPLISSHLRIDRTTRIIYNLGRYTAAILYKHKLIMDGRRVNIVKRAIS